MRLYGSDKPDLRVKLQFTELTDVMKSVDFKVFSGPATTPGGRVAITMPALHARIGDLVAAIRVATGADPALANYATDPALEAQFAAYPPLATPAAEALGMRHDGDIAALVARTLAGIDGASAR